MLSLNHRFHLSGDGLGELNKMYDVAAAAAAAVSPPPPSLPSFLSQIRAMHLKLCHLKYIGT